MSWPEFSSTLRHLQVRERERVKQAYELGFTVHDGQLRKSGEPFFSHPISVATILSDWGADADTLIAALLHDSVEDTPLTLEEVQEKFGPTVATLIEGVTKLTADEFGHKPTLDEATETLRKMFRLMEHDVRIIVIKLADRLHNMQTIQFLKPDRQQAIAQETLDIYVKVAEQLSMQDLRLRLEELSLHVLDTQLYKELLQLRDGNKIKGSETVEHITHQLEQSQFSSPSIRILHEQKSWQQLRLQFETHGAAVTGIPSLIIAIICKSIPDCYYMLGTLHQIWQREALSFQDYINSPLLNGYRGLHTTIILDDGTRIRCKIRTEEMHAYTKRGITTLCFDSKAYGLHHYIPWAERLTPLIEDTKDKSTEFWRGLQHDILGEAMPVHGPEAKPVMIPKGSSMLDGIFYLYGEQGIYTKEILANGKPVKFYDDLPPASSLRAIFDPAVPQLHLSWLQYVHTGIASAVIRRELAKMPTAEKKEIGRTLVEQSMQKRGTVGFGELDPDAISGQLADLGVSSIAELYEQVAEGKIDPDSVVRIFAPPPTHEKKQWSLKIDHPDVLPDDIFKILRSFFSLSLSVRQNAEGISVRGRFLLDPQQERDLESQLKTRLPQREWQLSETGKTRRLSLVIILLVLLWGLDPVFASYLLSGPLTPYDLTFLRFMTFFLATTIAYASQGYRMPQRLKPLNPMQPLLILSGISLFVTAFFSYLALTLLPATQYILFIVTGLLLLNLLKTSIQRKQELYLIFTLIAMLTGIVILVSIQGTSIVGVLAGMMSSLGFALYSQVSRRYQEEEAFIRARYPAFMFWVSGFGLLLSLPLIPYLSLQTLTSSDFLQAILFLFVFSLLPYLLYFECMRRTDSKMLDKTLPFVIISTFVGEALLTHSWAPLIATPLLLLFMVRREQL